MAPVQAGKLRPSQAVTQHGPGALLDLPKLSMVVTSASDWELGQCGRVDEPRLARRLRVTTFRSPPYFNRKSGSGGIPAAVFPHFLVCPRCHRLAPYDRFSFESHRVEPEFRCNAPDCPGAGYAVAYPARFMVACSRGHLADFPWHAYSHEPNVQCDGDLRLEDTGQTGAITDLWIKCDRHGVSKNLGQAFGQAGRSRLPVCGGERPWLGDVDPVPCAERPRVLLRGASNAYFPVIDSALSIPPWSDPVQQALGPYVDQMSKLASLEDVEAWLRLSTVPELEALSPAQIWAGLSLRNGEDNETPPDLRDEEWRAFQAEPGAIDERAQFQARSVPVPEEATDFIERVVLLERIREVRALRGFARIDPVPDVGDLGEVEALQAGMAPVMRGKSHNWYPGVEFRGEGIFLQLHEDSVRAWEGREAVQQLAKTHEQAQLEWNQARGLDASVSVPARYLLLHSFAHALVRQLALDCGYSSTSLRERIYSSNEETAPMAGVLIYTATSDSDGSLGGLVEMGRPEDLGPLIRRALDDARLCAGDPFCAGQEPSGSGEMNGAACHACLLIAETACEAGNRHLDRATLVPSLREFGIAIST